MPATRNPSSKGDNAQLAIGSMMSQHGETRPPPNWMGRTNWYNDDTVANLELMRQLNPLPNGRTIRKFSEYELHVQDGPMFRECATPAYFCTAAEVGGLQLLGETLQIRA